jgi:hypothetical protein
MAKKEVQRANSLLVMEKQRSEAVVQRQYELIECIGWLSEVGQSAAGDKRVSDLIDLVKKQLVEESSASSHGGDADGAGSVPGKEGIRLMEMIGLGTVCPQRSVSRHTEFATSSCVLCCTLKIRMLS